jgi:hypothetical protein
VPELQRGLATATARVEELSDRVKALERVRTAQSLQESHAFS